MRSAPGAGPTRSPQEVAALVSKIRARRAGITPPPWYGMHDDDGYVVYYRDPDGREMIVADLHRSEDGDALDEGDLAFIAHAPEDVDALLETVADLQAENARLRSMLSPLG